MGLVVTQRLLPQQAQVERSPLRMTFQINWQALIESPSDYIVPVQGTTPIIGFTTTQQLPNSRIR